MAPQLYGWQHILYLAITITLMTALWITIKKCARSERAVRIAVKLTALVLLAMILWNRWSICYYRDGFAFFLPQSFCGYCVSLITGEDCRGMRFTPHGVLLNFQPGTARLVVVHNFTWG